MVIKIRIAITIEKKKFVNKIPIKIKIYAILFAKLF